MANKLLQLPGNRLFNNSNIASPGGTATLYLSKTSTLANFLDASAVPLGPTITANGLGQLPDAYGDETVAYRVILRDSSGAQLDGGDIDPFYFGRDNSLITTTAGSSVSTRALLAAIANPVANQSAILTESGREGTFVFSTANLSTQVAADTAQGIYVAPSSDATGASGAWVRKFSGPRDIRWFGALSTGTDNSPAIQAAINSLSGAGGSIYIAGGQFSIGTNLTITSPVSFEGGRLVIPDGILVTLAGPVSAPRELLFETSGTGAVKLLAQTVGFPEWWGAKPNDASFDNGPALSACFAASTMTTLAPADYYVSDLVTFDYSGKTFAGEAPFTGVGRDKGVGAPARMGVAGQHARLILTGPKVVDTTVLLFGKATSGPGGNDDGDLMRDAVLRDIAVCRDQGTVKARESTSTHPINAVKGLVCAYHSSCLVERVASYDSPVGFHVLGSVYSKYRDCSAYRSTAADVTTNDFSVGFLIGDLGTNYGYAGANASVHFNELNAYDLVGGATTYGIKLFGAIADTVIHSPEVGRVQVGIDIDGADISGTTIPLSTLPTQQDVHLINPIVDSTTTYGIQIRRLNPSFQISIENPYVATASATADLYLPGGADKAFGNIQLIGGQFIGNGGTGIRAVDNEGLTVLGTMFRNYAAPIYLTNQTVANLQPVIYNTTGLTTNAILLEGGNRNTIRPQIYGAPIAGRFANGIVLTNSSGFNTIDGAAINYGYFQVVDAQYKVRYNGADARSNAAFTTAGNVLVGATG